jgi:trk system potassium uptake protein
MNPHLIIRTVSVLVLIISAFMGIPALVAIYFHEFNEAATFGSVILGAGGISLLLVFLTSRSQNKTMSVRDGFLFVTSSWIVASFVGALPFFLSGAIPSYTDAFFETISGFSTTGASILTNIEALPKSMLFWRSLTHWLGGMGIVVLTVAILPLLGIGGMQLIKAEAPGPTVDKLTPRIASTAKILWGIYILFTFVETLLLLLGGMGLFDAITHTFGTLATGGFSTRNTSVAAFTSPYIHWVITIFMVLAGVNFSLHYRLLSGKVGFVLRDSEFKAYILIFLISTLAITLINLGSVYSSFWESLRFSSFQSASILTTTGYATADYEKWPYLAQVFLFLLMFIGGSSGSTGGGIKVIRLVTLMKQGINEMKFLLYPRGIFILRISGNVVRKNIVYAISGFFFLYIVMLLFITMIVTSAGEDILTSFSTALATVGNIGPGFGNVGPTENYSHFPPYVKWWLSFAMLVGRLELYTVLILFTPRFWKW